MDNIYDIDSFDSWVTTVANTSDHPVVKSAQEMITYFFELEKLLPEQYGWRYYDTEAFQNIVDKSSKTPQELTTIYWRDVVRSLEAYGIIMYVRTNEVLRTAIRSLNNQELVPASILSRALLELSSSIIENSNIFRLTVDSVKPVENTVTIVSEDLEKLLLRIVWGTRIGEDIPEHLKQKNILTTLQKLSKNPNAAELMKRYEFLCELAHPNVVGNARFWGDNPKENSDGSLTILIQKRGYSESKREIIENIIWSLGWSAACVRNGYQIIHDTIMKIEQKFPGTVVAA